MKYDLYGGYRKWATSRFMIAAELTSAGLILFPEDILPPPDDHTILVKIGIEPPDAKSSYKLFDATGAEMIIIEHPKGTAVYKKIGSVVERHDQ
jgi:hypothetical protein